MPLTMEQRMVYCQQVWKNYQRQAKTNKQMSNADWVKIREWAEAEIPLGTIFQGIQETNGERKPFAYFVPAIQANIERWHKSMPLKQLPEAGKLEEFDVEAANRRKAEMLAKLRASQVGHEG